MTLLEAIQARHSVRYYKGQPLTDADARALQDKIEQLNREGQLHIQLIRNEPKAFLGPFARYGKFRGVTDYLVMAGVKADDLDERIGYYGEQLVLFAQTIGLNTCWVGLSYTKIPGTYVLNDGEVIQAYISIGYAVEPGQLPRVAAKRHFSLVGYTHMDLGIAKYHFEIGAGKDNFVWA